MTESPARHCPRCGGLLYAIEDGDRACLICARPVYAKAPLPKVEGEEKGRVYWTRRRGRPRSDT